MAFEHNFIDCNNDNQSVNSILGHTVVPNDTAWNRTKRTIPGQSLAFQDRWSPYWLMVIMVMQ